MLAAVILAAGESRRMGTPKALLPYRGGTFLSHLVAITRHPKIGLTRVVVGAHRAEIEAAANLLSAEIVYNADWQRGQLSSIQAAIRSFAEHKTDGILLCPVDHPLVTANLVSQLIEQFYATRKRIVLPAFQGKRGHPMIFSSKLYGELLSPRDDVGARAVVWAHADDVLEIATDEEGVILNLNDPAALERIKRD